MVGETGEAACSPGSRRWHGPRPDGDSGGPAFLKKLSGSWSTPQGCPSSATQGERKIRPTLPSPGSPHRAPLVRAAGRGSGRPGSTLLMPPASVPLSKPSKPQNRAAAIPQNEKVRCSWGSVSPWPGHPGDSTPNCSSNSCSSLAKPRALRIAGDRRPAWACLAPFPRPGEPQEGSGGARPRFLLTLQVTEEALRVESIIDECGYASALSRPGWGHLGTGFGWSIGLWLRPALAPAPPLTDMVWRGGGGGAPRKTVGAAGRGRVRPGQISFVD